MTAIGFTGPRTDMTPAQAEMLATLLSNARPAWRTLRQGCCVKCDEKAVQIARGLGFWIIGHPGMSARDGSSPWLSHVRCDARFPAKPYFERNRDIVNLSAVLIATPATPQQIPGRPSGTWYTINYAYRDARKMVYIIRTDGTVRILDPRKT